jgi:molecular chaperone GrpE
MMTKDAKPDKQAQKIAQLEQQIADLTDALQRERADAMNVRRRSDEDRIKLGSFYKSAVVRELLPVVDNFERALKHVPKELESNDYIKGVAGVVKQFEETLAKLGVQRIRTAGELFDPNLHEAVAMEEGDGTREVVSEELQSGYVLGDEVLRHAMVKVRMEQ